MSRISPRERLLALVSAGVVFTFINLLLLNTLLDIHRDLSLAVAEKQRTWDAMRVLLDDAPFWQKRDQWLREHQPALASPQRAGIELLNHVTTLAARNKVVLEGQQVNPPDSVSDPSRAYRDSLSIRTTTRSNWADLVRFLAALQPRPEDFIVIESTHLQSDPQDAGTMKGELRIGKWFAPGMKVP